MTEVAQVAKGKHRAKCNVQSPLNERFLERIYREDQEISNPSLPPIFALLRVALHLA